MITPENRQLVRDFKAVGCGSCKATGEEHTWDAKADLVPTGRLCKACDGTGLANGQRTQETK